MSNSPTVLPHVYGHIRLFTESFSDIKNSYSWQEPFLSYPIDLGKIQNPDVVAFSVYIWNVNRCIAAAREIKEKFPECLVVMGGPQFGDEKLKFLEDHPYVDIIVYNEGEIPFKNILLENTKANPEWKNVKGIGFRKLKNETQYIKTEREERLDLSHFQESPYEVYYDYYKKLRDEMENYSSLPFAVLETNRGCPYECGFCNWGALTANAIFQYPMEKVKKDIYYIGKLKPKAIQIADANFGILPRDNDISKLIVSDIGETNPGHVSFHINYAKVMNKRVVETYKTLRSGPWEKISPISINIQSMNEKSLKVIKRNNIGWNVFPKKFQMVKDNFSGTSMVSTDLIIGLPEETLSTYIEGVIGSFQMGISFFALYHLCLIPGTDINDPKYIDMYQLETVKRKIHPNTYSGKDTSFAEEIDMVIATNSMSRKDIIYGAIFTGVVASYASLFREMIPQELFQSKTKLTKLINEFTEFCIQENQLLQDLLSGERVAFSTYVDSCDILKADFKANRKKRVVKLMILGKAVV